jgi:hypothetical protein
VSSRVKAFAVVAVAAIIVGVFWAGSRSPTLPGYVESAADIAGAESLQGQPTHQEADALRAHLEKQEATLERVISRMAQLEYELRSDRARLSTGPDQYAAADEPYRMTPEQFDDMVRAQEDEAIEKDRQRIAAIDSGWMNEPVDPSWAVRYENDVRDAVSSAGFETVSLMDIDCRYSVCKLELNADQTINAEDLNLNLIELEPFQNTEFTTTTPEGGDPGPVIIYLARPGGEGLSHLSDRP